MAPHSGGTRRYHFGPFVLDVRDRELRRQDVPIPLTPKVFDTLLALVEHAGHVVDKPMLLQRVWPDSFVEEGNLAQNVFTLRKTLGDTPQGHTYIQTLPKRGYRFVASVQVDAGAAPDRAPAEGARGVANAIQPRRRIGRRAITGIVVSVVMALLSIAGWRRQAAPPPRDRSVLLVLPFENLTGDPGQEFFSDGLTEELIAQLSRLNPERLAVVARTSAMAFKRTRRPISEIGPVFGADYVLEGSARRSGDRVRITAQLIETRGQTHVWSET